MIKKTKDHQIRNALSSIYLGLQVLKRKGTHKELVESMIKNMEELMILLNIEYD